MTPQHLNQSFERFKFNLTRAEHLIAHSKGATAEIQSEILRATLIVLAGAIDTLFHSVIVSEAVHRFTVEKFATDKLRNDLSDKLNWFDFCADINKQGSSAWLKNKLTVKLSKISLYSAKNILECWKYCSKNDLTSTVNLEKFKNYQFFEYLKALETRRDRIVHESDFGTEENEGISLSPIQSSDIEELLVSLSKAKEIIEENLNLNV